MGYVKELDDDLQLGDLEAAADYLVVHDDVQRGRGPRLLHGRHAALKAAATGRFDRAVAFYGMIRAARRLGGPEDAPAARHRRRRVPDARDLRRPATATRPPPTSTRSRAAWADRPDCEIVVYDGADHGFVHAPERPAHRADDAADAWRRTLAFLTARLRAGR